MAKKFGKVLLFTAAVAAVGGAAYYYMKKKDAELMAELDDDYDDFSEDLDEGPARSYVPLPHEEAPVADVTEHIAPHSQEAPAKEEPLAQDTAAMEPADTSSSVEDSFTPLTEKVAEVAEDISEEVEEAVEEFFDEEDEEN